MNKLVFTRQELYDLVWSEPLIRIAKKYNISDNGLRKICKKMDIPLPDNGYWQKVNYNKPVNRKKLPISYNGPNEIKLTDRNEENITNPAATGVKSILKSYETIDQSIFRVPERLTNPDKLIIAAQRTLTSKKTSEWSRWLVNTYSEEISIKVAPASVSRALRIMDTIIKVLRFKGYDLIVGSRETYAVIEGEKIEIALREKLRVEKVVEKNGWNTNKYYPIGQLILRVDRTYRSKEFVDGEKSLEEKLPSIIAEIEYRGQKEKEERIKHEIRRKQEEERQRIEKERKARKDKEIQDFKNLLHESKSWHKSVILDNYIKEVEKRATENNTLTEELKTWLMWAKNKAEWFNPFIKKEDEFLTEQDRFLF